MKNIYGKKSILTDKCEFAGSPGLLLDPPLFEETVLCNQVQFKNQREVIDHFLKTGDIDADASEKAPNEILRKIFEILKKAGPYLPFIMKVIAWLLKILFPQLPEFP